jgi:hypothetical protein
LEFENPQEYFDNYIKKFIGMMDRGNKGYITLEDLQEGFKPDKQLHRYAEEEEGGKRKEQV